MARNTNIAKPKAAKAGASPSAERSAAALRENLRRRKRQQRLRDAADTQGPAKTDG
jgi:hypothetical protein